MKSRNIIGMIFISLLLLSCGKTGVESNIKKDDKIVSLREYNNLKETALPKRRVVNRESKKLFKVWNTKNRYNNKGYSCFRIFKFWKV